MSRYIDADVLLDIFKVLKWYASYSIVNGMPTADVVEVVRCKDCKFQGHIQRCPFGKRDMPHANGYCCYGERREDDE